MQCPNTATGARSGQEALGEGEVPMEAMDWVESSWTDHGAVLPAGAPGWEASPKELVQRGAMDLSETFFGAL